MEATEAPPPPSSDNEERASECGPSAEEQAAAPSELQERERLPEEKDASTSMSGVGLADIPVVVMPAENSSETDKEKEDEIKDQFQDEGTRQVEGGHLTRGNGRDLDRDESQPHGGDVEEHLQDGTGHQEEASPELDETQSHGRDQLEYQEHGREQEKEQSPKQMPVKTRFQLPLLSSRALLLEKTMEDTPTEEKTAVLKSSPAISFEVHPLVDFARAHFNLTPPRASIFRPPPAFDLSKRLQWEKQVITSPLTSLPKEQAAVAVQAFRNISGFMGNRSSGKGQLDHCFKLLRNVVPRSSALKDEIYCQLCKQLTRNPSANAVMNGWLLLNACLVTFSPSPPLATCLERFISAHVGTGGCSEAEIEISAFAMDALAALRCCTTKDERKEIPSPAELRALQRHTLNEITASLADGSTVSMHVSAWTTTRELADLIARKLGVCNARAFTLFEVGDDNEEHLVPDGERILDLYAQWERTHVDPHELKHKKNKSANKKKASAAPEPEVVPSAMLVPTGDGYRLVYKAYLWVHVDDDTAADVRLYYLQAVKNVLGGVYVCDLAAAVELAGYQLYCKLAGSQPPSLSDLTKEIHEYIPRSLLSSSNRASIAKSVLDGYHTFVNSWCVQSTQQARLAYLRLCKRQPFYGATLFPARNSRYRDILPSRVMVAINEMGIGIVSADTDEVLALFAYTDIEKWGYSANSFVFNVVRGTEQTEYSFKTPQGKAMNDNVAAYVDYIISLSSVPSTE